MISIYVIFIVAKTKVIPDFNGHVNLIINGDIKSESG